MKGERSYQHRPSKLQGEADPYVKAMEASDQRIADLEHRLRWPNIKSSRASCALG